MNQPTPKKTPQIITSLEPHDSDGAGGHWFWAGVYIIRLSVEGQRFWLDLIEPGAKHGDEVEDDVYVKSVQGGEEHPFHAAAVRYDHDGDLDAFRPILLATLEAA